jgi:pimeloyl-ACP methyl ester carboxylesterase
MKEIAADMIGVLDDLGEQQAVIIGHDWGSMIAWQSALMYPERYRAVVGMSVPFVQRSPMAPTQLFKAVFANNFFYILYFQEPGKAEAEFEANVDQTFRRILGGQVPREGEEAAFTAAMTKPKDSKFFDGLPPAPQKLPPWLSEEDLAYFAGEFKRTGCRGGLNKYRNMDRDWEESAHLQGGKITQPALFITGDKDPVRTFTNLDGMKADVPNLKQIIELPGGHWIQQEQAQAVNDALIGFLKEL